MSSLSMTFFTCALALGDARAKPDEPGLPRAPETSSKVKYQCRHIGEQDIKIDGKVEEKTWQLAEPMTHFTLVRTDGKRAEKTTTARLLWDEKYLYVAFDCVNDGIRTTLTKRDDPVWEGEAAELFICPRGADAFYYEINFNPRNVIYDSRIESWQYQDQVKNWQKWARGFNAQIKSATEIQRDKSGNVTGWSVEAAIPFQDLDVAEKKAPAAGEVWLFNVFRVAVKQDGSAELAHWQPVKPEFHRPQQFPRLEFVGKR